MQVEEFCKSAPAYHLNHPEEGVYIVWKWNWASIMSYTSTMHSSVPSLDDIDSRVTDNSEVEDDVSQRVLDTVRFKVIVIRSINML